MSPPDQRDPDAFTAFEDWRAAKLKSDQTMTFADARATALAWVRFQNLYLGHDNRLAIVSDRSPAARIVPFPPRHPDLGGAV